MPQPSTKTRFKRGFKKWTDDKVIEIRKQLGLKDFSPICAFKLCEFLGIPVCTPSDISGLADYYLDRLTDSDNASCWSAVTIPVGGTKHIIIHNPSHAPSRQQSNIMHEIGHILCGHTISQETGNIGVGGCLRSIDGEKESEAEWFGACLQLPRQALLYCLKSGMTLNDIALRYNCSLEMAQYRINITGVQYQMSRMKKRNPFIIH